MSPRAKAVIADDEPVMRDVLKDMLAEVWPELVVCAEAENGVKALRALETYAPDILFLDVEMPGMSGLEVAQQASGKCHVVFVTAHDDYAVSAFEQGGVDYVKKPFSMSRLATSVSRLKQRVQSAPTKLPGEKLRPGLLTPTMPAPTAASIAALQDSLLQAISARGGTRTFPANAIIISEGDLSDSLYIILSGRVKVFAANEAGKEVILTVLGPGDYIGEMALDGGPRSASVMTLAPTSCSVVPGERLREFIAEYPDFAVHFIHKLIRRVREANESVKSLALMDVYGRVARLLLELAVDHDGKLVIEDKLTHQDIADRVGSSREMVSRVLKDLTVGGYLSSEGKHITIHKKPPPGW